MQQAGADQTGQFPAKGWRQLYHANEQLALARRRILELEIMLDRVST